MPTIEAGGKYDRIHVRLRRSYDLANERLSLASRVADAQEASKNLGHFPPFVHLNLRAPLKIVWIGRDQQIRVSIIILIGNPADRRYSRQRTALCSDLPAGEQP